MAVHLLESDPGVGNAEYSGPAGPAVTWIGWSQDTVWLDAKSSSSDVAGTIGFAGVPEQVWKFEVGAYQVAAKWLKDRKGRRLSDEDLLHYRRIVSAISETICLMLEIDEMIGEHGGWPNAFAAPGLGL